MSLLDSAGPSYPAFARDVEAWADANDHNQLGAGEAVTVDTEWAAADRVLDAIVDEGLAEVTDVFEDADLTDEEAADATAEAITMAVLDGLWFGIWLATHGRAVWPPRVVAAESNETAKEDSPHE